MVRHRPADAALSRRYRVCHRGHDRGDAPASHHRPFRELGHRLPRPHPPSPVVYEPIPADGFELEGQRLLAVETGHTDTDDTTVLYVPSIGVVVAGDVAYNGVHQYLLESADGGIESWLAAIDKVAALQPRAVVAGHKNKDLPDDPTILDQTRDYLLNAQRLLAENPSPREYFDRIIALYPDRLNVGPVWYSAVALLS